MKRLAIGAILSLSGCVFGGGEPPAGTGSNNGGATNNGTAGQQSNNGTVVANNDTVATNNGSNNTHGTNNSTTQTNNGTVIANNGTAGRCPIPEVICGATWTCSNEPRCSDCGTCVAGACLSNICIEPPDLEHAEGETGEFGFSVSISPNLLAVGAPGAGNGGKVLLRQRGVMAGSIMVEPSTLQPPADRFGHAVAVSDRSLLVGDPGRGTVTAYSQGGDLKTVLPLPASAGHAIDVGWGMTRNGEHFETAIVGAPASNAATIVYTGDFGAADTWLEGVTIKPQDGDCATGCRFGESVAINQAGDIVAVGAPDEGYVDIWRFDLGLSEWRYASTIRSSPSFGFRVDLSAGGELLAIGTQPGLGASEISVWRREVGQNWDMVTDPLTSGSYAEDLIVMSREGGSSAILMAGLPNGMGVGAWAKIGPTRFLPTGQGIQPPPTTAAFGHAMAIWDDVVVIGAPAPGPADGEGSVWVGKLRL